MADSISLNLLTGRTIQQGITMEGGKNTPAYTEACGIIELDPADFKRLGAYRSTNVRVTSDYGSVVVKAVETTQGPHPGLAYIPMGAWANAVINPNTYGMGMPTFKGTPIQVSIATNEPVLSSVTLVQKLVKE